MRNIRCEYEFWIKMDKFFLLQNYNSIYILNFLYLKLESRFLLGIVTCLSNISGTLCRIYFFFGICRVVVLWNEVENKTRSFNGAMEYGIMDIFSDFRYWVWWAWWFLKWLMAFLLDFMALSMSFIRKSQPKLFPPNISAYFYSVTFWLS